MLQVPFADFARELLHVSRQLSAQSDLHRRERRSRRNISSRHSHPKPPK
jgi:hypothetical protein